MIRGGRRAHLTVNKHKTQVGIRGKLPFRVLRELWMPISAREKFKKLGKTRIKCLGGIL